MGPCPRGVHGRDGHRGRPAGGDDPAARRGQRSARARHARGPRPFGNQLSTCGDDPRGGAGALMPVIDDDRRPGRATRVHWSRRGGRGAGEEKPGMRSNTLLRAVAGAAALGLLLGACGPRGGTASEPAVTAPPPPTPAASAEAGASAEPTEKPALAGDLSIWTLPAGRRRDVAEGLQGGVRGAVSRRHREDQRRARGHVRDQGQHRPPGPQAAGCRGHRGSWLDEGGPRPRPDAVLRLVGRGRRGLQSRRHRPRDRRGQRRRRGVRRRRLPRRQHLRLQQGACSTRPASRIRRPTSRSPSRSTRTSAASSRSPTRTPPRPSTAARCPSGPRASRTRTCSAPTGARPRATSTRPRWSRRSTSRAQLVREKAAPGGPP